MNIIAGTFLLLLIIAFSSYFVFPDSLPTWLPDRAEFLLSLPGLVLTLSLVWYHLSSNPDPTILRQPKIDPRSESGSVAVENNEVRVEGEANYVGPSTVGWRKFKKFKVDYNQPPRSLRVHFDIGNKGRSGTTLHEIRIENRNEHDEVNTKVIPLYDVTTIRIPDGIKDISEGIYEKIPALFVELIPDWSDIGVDYEPENVIVETANRASILNDRDIDKFQVD